MTLISDTPLPERAFAAVRGLHRFLLLERVATENPTANVDQPRWWKPLPNVLAFDEVDVPSPFQLSVIAATRETSGRVKTVVGTGTPELAVAVEGTGPIAQIDIIKNSKIVYTSKPNFVGEDSFSYIRRGLTNANEPLTATVNVTVQVAANAL